MDEAMNNYTPRAQQLLALAKRQAENHQDEFVGTEHLLLGITMLPESTACKVLASVNITSEVVNTEIEKHLVTGLGRVPGSTRFSPRVKKVLRLAAKECEELNHQYIGTEHILLGLLRESDGKAAQILRGFNANTEAIRAEIIKFLSPLPPTEEKGGTLEEGRKKLLDILDGKIHITDVGNRTFTIRFKDLACISTDLFGCPQPVKLKPTVTACLIVAAESPAKDQEKVLIELLQSLPPSQSKE